MVVFNYSGGEVNAKIVYYGPGLSGKTTNLEHIYAKMPARLKGKMISMKTRTDRTLFFDFLPLELGDINGFKLRFLLYTVPGQVYYNATRKLVLKGADAVVFVADSDPSKMEENIESLKNLETNLNEHNLTLDSIPWVIQYNKRDLENALPVETLGNKLNVLKVPSFEAVATDGKGVYETFQMISRLLYQRVHKTIGEDNGDVQSAGEATIPIKDKTIGAGNAEILDGKQNAKENESAVDVVEVALREVSGREIQTAGEITGRKSGEKNETPPVSKSGDGMYVPVAADRGKESQKSGAGETEASTVPSDESSAGGEFQFAAIAEDSIDNEMGRVLDLDSAAASPERIQSEDAEDGFITDPCRAGAQAETQKDDEKAPAKSVKMEKRPGFSESEETVVNVPVVIKASEVQKSIPLKLVLDIQVLEED